jgi:hypothetical protein
MFTLSPPGSNPGPDDELSTKMAISVDVVNVNLKWILTHKKKKMPDHKSGI